MTYPSLPPIISREGLPEWFDDKLLGRNSEVFLQLTHLKTTTFQQRACPHEVCCLGFFSFFLYTFFFSCCQHIVDEEDEDAEDDEDDVEEDDEYDENDQEYGK